MKKYLLFTIITTSLTLSACGSGGTSTNHTSSATTQPTSGSLSSTASNVVPIVIDNGPTGRSPDNTPFVSVTVCSTNNPTNCQTIDHIILDTGSMGLRIFADKLNSSLNLIPQTINGQTTAECTLFGSGYDWGSIALANVQMAGEIANNIPIQIINDTTIPSAPSDCSNEGVYNDLGGANGIIGVNPLPYDQGNYYSCSGSSCTLNDSIDTDQQIVSPVYKFNTDNNGVIVTLPQVPSTGATSLSGTLTFGIGTQSNNQLTAQNVFTSNGTEQDASFTTTYAGGTYDSIFDTGSTEVFFSDPYNNPVFSICSDVPGIYCPNGTKTIVTQLASLNSSAGVNFNFDIINYDDFVYSNPNSVAIPNSGGTGVGNLFIWGLPFFYGRTVFTAFSGASTPRGKGPYFAV